MKRFSLALIIAMIAVLEVFASNPSGGYSSVAGEIYEGEMPGVATWFLTFRDDGVAEFVKMSGGKSPGMYVAYEQEGANVVVHDPEGDIKLTLSLPPEDVMTADIDGKAVKFYPRKYTGKTPAMKVAGHTFSGRFTTDGTKDTVTFQKDGKAVVKYPLGKGNMMKETWNYTQDGGEVVLSDSNMPDVTVTLYFDRNNELVGKSARQSQRLKLVR